MADSDAASLPYEEPDIVTILIQSSFLLLLNVVNYILDHTLYCGLLGQVFIGVAWGSPGGKWLSTHVEEVIVQLGYLGLILLVYEGGLSTSFFSLKANVLLSVGVALTGICVPIALSFTLKGLVGASPLQAFAAGAALCSTSLGTTFTVLSTSGLTTTRLGVVLTSAAIMDDVVGLVMVQVIASLGSSAMSISAVTIIRPVLVSLAFVVALPFACRYIVKPMTLWSNSVRQSNPDAFLHKVLSRTGTVFIAHTALLVGLVTGASYAGTSNLFAAYLAGAAVSWWDAEVPHVSMQINKETGRNSEDSAGAANKPSSAASQSSPPPDQPAPVLQDGPAALVSGPDLSGSAVYEAYYQQTVERILKPLFFASIGFSIPITRMFEGSIVWRGIVYTILMTLGKLICGLWLVRIALPSPISQLRKGLKSMSLRMIPRSWRAPKTSSSTPNTKQKKMATETAVPSADDIRLSSRPAHTTDSQDHPPSSQSDSTNRSPQPRKPRSLYPAAILGSTMVARGEIGFLISSVAESNGVFAASAPDGSTAAVGDSEIFLIVTWAIVLCTVIGPLCVGLLVRRVKRLEREREGGREDALGIWGVR